MTHAYLLSYFLSEDDDGEQVRFAVSDGPDPYRWTPIAGGAPVVEGWSRDPFVLRTDDGFVLLATDLRVGPHGDWTPSTREGSRSILVWHSPDLLAWTGPVRHEVAPPGAGNAWAPKAFRTADGRFLVFFASALYAEGADRAAGTYQRILAAATRDFRSFEPAEVVLDAGHDVIDATFLEHGGRTYRFSANAHAPGGMPDRGHHIFEEVGSTLTGDFEPLTIDIGKDVMARAEGPAVCADPGGERWYLLADEFGLRGYQLFETDDLTSGEWRHVADAKLPEGARHGSLLAVTLAEAEALRGLQ